LFFCTNFQLFQTDALFILFSTGLRDLDVSAIYLIKDNVNCLFYSHQPLVVDSVYMTCERIPYEDAKISFLIKLPQIFLSIVENETTATENSEMIDVRLPSIEEFIKSLLQNWPNKHFIHHITRSAHCINPKVLRKR